MKFVLLDTCILIGAFDGDMDNKIHQQHKALVSEILQDETVKIAITPLIRYEVLRGVKNITFDEMKITSNKQDFEKIDKIVNFMQTCLDN